MSDINPSTDDGTIKEALYPPLTYSATSRAILGQKTQISAQAIREQVDRRISQLEEEIRVLKTHRNLVADTSPLPAEILSNIFIVLRELVDKSTGDYHGASWARVARVCRHWRAVALDCPALWSNLLFVSPENTEMMLQQSKNTPLTVKFSGNPVRYHDVLCKIMSQTGRLRNLEMKSSYSNTAIDFPKVLSNFTTAPILEKLVLGGVPGKYGFLPDNFLQDGAPSLRHLELTQFAVRWDPLPLSSTLTHLRLQNIAPNRPLRETFLESMAKLLRLESLELSGCLPRSGNVSQPSRPPPISLPSLRILGLQDSAAELCQFFWAAQIPKETRVDIEVSDANPQSESLGPIFSALKTSWVLCQDTESVADSSLARHEIWDLRVVNSTSRCVKCWFKDHEPPPLSNDNHSPANFVISSKTSRGASVSTLLTAIAEDFDISSLHSLKIASMDHITPEAIALFQGLTQLNTVSIWYNHATLKKFLGALKDGANTGTPPFPLLRSVCLQGIDFDEKGTGDSEAAVRKLIKAFEHREEFCSIDELFLTLCINFSEGDWVYLRESLPEAIQIHWDGDEDMREPSDHGGECDCCGSDWYGDGMYDGMHDYDYW